MSQPILDVELLKAVQAVQTAIRAINGQIGYHVTVHPDSVTLDPVNLLTMPVGALLPFFVLELTDQGDRTFEPADMVEDRRVVAITWRHDVPGRSYDRKMIAFAQIEADLERALATDPTLGGLAVDIRLRQGTRLVGDPTNDIVIGMHLLDVHLYRQYGAPEGL